MVSKKSLSIQSAHSSTIIQRLSQYHPSSESPGFLNCCSLPRSSKVISHDASLLLSPQGSLIVVAPFLGAPMRLSFMMPLFLPSPQVSFSDAPFLGTQGSDQSPLLCVEVGSCLGTGPRALPYPVAPPGKLVVPPMSPV